MTDPSDREIELSTISSTLLDRARQGNDEAWNALVETHTPLVAWWCLGRGLSAAETTDITQDVFLAVFRNLDSFTRTPKDSDSHQTEPPTEDSTSVASVPGGTQVVDSVTARPAEKKSAQDPEPKKRGTFRGWLWAITRNKIRDHWRSEKDREYLPRDDVLQEEVLPEDEPESSSGTQVLSRAIYKFAEKNFKENVWLAFWMTAVEGKSIADVAESLNTTPNNVSLARGRVPKRLREIFGERMDELFPPRDQDLS